MSKPIFELSTAQKRSDIYQTPLYAVVPLFKYIPVDWVIWEPACGNGNIVSAFKQNGYKVFGTDIIMGDDFLTDNSPRLWDCIITNPPFSLKTGFIERACKYNKPFAFLMNLNSLETSRRQTVYKKYGLQLILLDKRVNFEIEGQETSASWFATAWFTFGLNLDNDIIYERIEK